MTKELDLTATAHRLKLGYNVALRLVLIGVLEGRRDARNRWAVTEASIAKYEKEQV